MTGNVRENRVRRAAERQGLQLVKSRLRDPNTLDYGTCGLLDAGTRVLLRGTAGTAYGVNLDDIERELGNPGGSWWAATSVFTDEAQ